MPYRCCFQCAESMFQLGSPRRVAVRSELWLDVHPHILLVYKDRANPFGRKFLKEVNA